MSSPPAASGRLFLAALVAITSLGPLALQLFVPSLPAIARDFGVSIGKAQYAFSLSMVAIAFATLVYGPLSDRYGRRPALLGGISLFLVGTVVCALATSIEMLIVGRILQASGSSAGLVVSRAIARDVYGPDRAASVIAYLTVAMILAPFFALILGGLFVDTVGWRYNFAFALACGLIVVALLRMGLPETHQGPRIGIRPSDLLRNYGRLLRSGTFLGYAIHGAGAAGGFFAFAAGAPYLITDVLGRPALEFSLYFAVLSLFFMLANYLAGRYTRRIGLDRMVIWGGVFSVVCAVLAIAALAIWGLTPLALFAPAAFIWLGNGITMPNANAGAINVDARLAGTASGLTAFLTMIVGAICSQAVGSLADGTAWPLVLCVFVITVISCVAGILPAWLRRRAQTGMAA